MQFIIKSKLPAAILILAGSITWSLTMVKSGLVYPFGMGFWGPNGHDGIWHVALINHLAKGSYEMPIFSGAQIQNYHIGFDLALAWIYKLTNIPAHTLYFQILPPILAILIGLLTYKLVRLWRKSTVQAFWATFFVYFAGDFGWVVTLVREGAFGGESRFWAQQAVSTLINPPFAASLVLILGGLICLLKFTRKFSLKYLVLSILLFGALAQIKVYAGILVLGTLGLVLLFQIMKYGITPLRNSVRDCGMVFLGSALLSVFLFLQLNSSPQKLIVIQPFWFLETMMAVSDRFGWERFYEAMMNYKTGNIWIKLIPAYIAAFLIFFFGNLGTRMLGVYGIWKNGWKKLEEVDVFLLGVALLGTVLPMIILQAGTPWNTIQFFYYTLFVFAIYAGVWLGGFIERNKKKSKYNILVYYTVGAVILLTIPTSLSTLLLHYLPMRPPAKISNEELEGLRFLEKQPDGVVLTYPFDAYAAELAVTNPPRPLYLYESTAYVSAFSAKAVYLEDEINLNITGYDWRARRKKAEEFFRSLDHSFVRSFLRDNNIGYIYWVGKQRAKLGETQLGVTQIFEDSQVKIYRVD